MSENSPFVSGFVSILGRPSAGKSTLLNAMMGAKLAIVAAQPQTTRTSIQGVWTSRGPRLSFSILPAFIAPTRRSTVA
jgi:GTPase